MARKVVSRTDGGYGTRLAAGQLLWLGAAAVTGLSAAYAGIARLLIGEVEDLSDVAAARRLRRLNLAAARQQNISGVKAPRPRS